LAIDEQNAQKQASVLDLRKNRIVADCRRMGRECKKNVAARDFTRPDW
jgi:hypothetical protein